MTYSSCEGGLSPVIISGTVGARGELPRVTSELIRDGGVGPLGEPPRVTIEGGGGQSEDHKRGGGKTKLTNDGARGH